MEAVGRGGSIVAFTQEEMKWLERSSSSSDEVSPWLPLAEAPTPAAAAAALGVASKEVGRANFDPATAGAALAFFSEGFANPDFASVGRCAVGLADFAEAAGAEGALAAPAINFDCATA